jgi:hypothetical protein
MSTDLVDLIGALEDNALPAYDLPPNFEFEAAPRTLEDTPTGAEASEIIKIAGKYTLPLLSAAEPTAHLRLLAAFAKLKEAVSSQTINGIAAEDSWSIFAQRAVHRFELWALNIAGANGSSTLTVNELPPMDVAMVWHTYMLVSVSEAIGCLLNRVCQNPLVYYEDCRRLLPGLNALQCVESLPHLLSA